MVYESDFYTVRRPYTRPTITSYSVTAIRPCMSIRGVIAPPGTHSKVRMSVLLGELNRIQHRHRPHLAIVPTEDFLCSRPLVDFDDEAKHIRAAADKLIRYVHTSVPHESRLPIRIVTAYDRYGPEGRYVSKYSPDIPTNIQCLSYYKEPSRVTIGRGHLACVSYAGGRGYPRRKHLYGDEIRDIGDEIKFRSYYARNVHPSRNDDALLLPTGFASRILLPDRRLLGTDEGRALVFQSKLIKPVSSGLSIKKEKPEKNTEKAPKPKSRTQVIEEQILAEEGAKTAGAKAPANVPVEVVEIEEPREEIPKEEEPAPIINRQLSTPAASEPEPEPIKEVTPPPVEPKQKSRKVDSKKKSSIKTPPVELEQLVEAVPVEEPEAAEEPIIVQEPTVEEKPAASDLEVQPVTATESITTELVNPEPVKEEPKSEPEEQPVELSTTEPEASDPEPSQPVEEAPLPPPVESQEPEAQEPAQEAAPAVDADAPSTEAEPQKEEVVAADATPSEEIPAEQTASEGDNKVASDEVSNPTEPESVPTAESSDVLPPSTPCEPEPTPEVADSPAPAEAAIEEASEEPQPAEDPQSRLEAAPEAEADPSSNTTAGVEEEPQDEIAGQPAEPQPQNPSDEPIISEVEGTPSSEVPPETTEPIVEEPPSPVTEQ